MGDPDGLEGLAPVHRLEEGSVQDVHGVRIRGIGNHVAVVPAAGAQPALTVHPRPGVSAVIAAIETASLLGGGHERVHPARVGRGDGHADLSDRVLLGRFRQPAPDQFPRLPAVPGPVETALRTAVNERPGFPLRLPHGGEEFAGIRRVHRELNGSGRVGNLEHRGPRRPAVLRQIDAPLGRTAEDLAEHRDEGAVRVARIHHDPADQAGGFEAHVGPGPSGVGAAVNAVPHGDVAARAGGAGAHVNDVGVRGSDRHRADGPDGEIVVAQIRPGDAGVLRLPDAAPGRTHVEDMRLVGNAGDGGHPPAARRSHHPEIEVLENLGGHLESFGNRRALDRSLPGGGRGHGREQEHRAREGCVGPHAFPATADPTTASTSISTRYSSPMRSA